MFEQLSLFPISSDILSVSLLKFGSDTKIRSIQRFCKNSKSQPTACVNTYSPGGRNVKYYRLSFNWNNRKKHIHIPGGNINSSLAIARAEELQQAIDRGEPLDRILAAVETFKVK